MATVIKMPKQGQSVESCILTEWYKNVGDKVSKGELFFAYETDKAAFEEEALEDGILLARFFEEGDDVPVLENIAVIGVEGESFEEYHPGIVEGDASETKGKSLEKVKNSVSKERTGHADSGWLIEPGPEAAHVSAKPGSNGRIAISPRARKLAGERRVVFESIAGSGPGGRIIEQDILEEIRKGKRLTPLAKKKMEGEGLAVPGEAKTPYGKITSKDLVEGNRSSGGIQKEKYTDVPLSNMRKIIANAMYQSLQNSAQLTHHLSANASKMLQLRKLVKSRVQEGYTCNITLNDMVCYALIRALKQFPDANAHLMGDKLRRFNDVNLGLAVDTGRGLMVPVLLNADELSLPDLSLQLKKMAESSKKGNISPDLLLPEAASFSVSNLGNYGVEMFTPVINLPQVAILGVNTIIQRPIVMEDGSFGFQPFIGLSLTYDHRALDGGQATLFLAEIKKEIEKLSPELL